MNSQSSRSFKLNLGNINVGDSERVISVIGGSALLLYGMFRRGLRGTLTTLLGGLLLYRGTVGRCPVYQSLGVSTARSPQELARMRHQQGVKLDESIVVNKTPQEAYQFWHDFSNMSRFMNYVEQVQDQGGGRSHWVAQVPGGIRMEWDAELIKDKPNDMISWQSVPGSDVNQAGSVHFEPTPDGRGTRVELHLDYVPPAGPLGHAVVNLLGPDPMNQIKENMRRFKELLETGEIPTTQGQPTGSPQAQTTTIPGQKGPGQGQQGTMSQQGQQGNMSEQGGTQSQQRTVSQQGGAQTQRTGRGSSGRSGTGK